MEGLKGLFLDYGMNISCKKHCFSALTSVQSSIDYGKNINAWLLHENTMLFINNCIMY